MFCVISVECTLFITRILHYGKFQFSHEVVNFLANAKVIQHQNCITLCQFFKIFLYILIHGMLCICIHVDSCMISSFFLLFFIGIKHFTVEKLFSESHIFLVQEDSLNLCLIQFVTLKLPDVPILVLK